MRIDFVCELPSSLVDLLPRENVESLDSQLEQMDMARYIDEDEFATELDTDTFDIELH